MTDVTLANGNVRLAASIDGPMDAVPILLLHGASVSRDTWDETKQRLMDRYCVWTSIFVVTATLIARRITTSQVMSDAKAALAAIGRPAIVVGYSLWACVVRVFSQINPNVLRSSQSPDRTLCAPGSVFWGGGARYFRVDIFQEG